MGLKFVDTHSHLYLDEFKEDIADIVRRMTDSFVEEVYLPNIDSSTMESLDGLVKDYPEIFYPMMGLHPCSVKKDTYREELRLIEDRLKQKPYIAIGEIGMDLHWDPSTKGIQEEVFLIQCQWASDRKLPIAIHSRNATRELITILNENNFSNLTGVFHCFGDGLAEANDIIALGFKLGIGGVLTFKNSGLDAVVKDVDLEHIILETDSPYLAPVPYRGKRNESSYIRLIADKLASVKGILIEEVSDITTKNARELFGNS